jgi:16S rRNA (cytosine967-C5)-methyltransferase
MAKISSARKAAFQILMGVERGQSHSDDLLRGKAVNALSVPDRNLATALVLGVLRWQIQLDHQCEALLTRPNAKLDPEIRIALRLGAFQLLHMDRIPARAAIDESVELAQQMGHHFASGMVNAVLRKMARYEQTLDSLSAPAEALDSAQGTDTNRDALKGHDFSRATSAGRTDEALQNAEKTNLGSRLCQGMALQAAEKLVEAISKERFVSGHDFSRAVNAAKSTRALAPGGNSADLALAQAHPVWMVERWLNFYGLDAARAICIHGQSQPVLTLRLASPTAEAELAAAGIVLEPGELLSAARTVVSGDVTATDAFRDCRVRFQDEGSQLVAELAGFFSKSENNPDQRQRKILDACAAPGGKTLILAERNPQARIVACESSAARLEQLRKRLAYLGERVECRLADATALTEESVYDLALADVPCSGTGTLGRNPEIRHRLRPEDLMRQAERQRTILAAALRAVRPGGLVVYSTCSLEPEENEQVVAAVLAATPNARLVSLDARIDQLLKAAILTDKGAECLHTCLTSEGFLRLLPGKFHTDGFFVAMIERTN